MCGYNECREGMVSQSKIWKTFELYEHLQRDCMREILNLEDLNNAGCWNFFLKIDVDGKPFYHGFSWIGPFGVVGIEFESVAFRSSLFSDCFLNSV